MLKRTSTKKSPWVIIDSNDKHDALIAAMQYILLTNDYPGKCLQSIGTLDKKVIQC